MYVRTFVYMFHLFSGVLFYSTVHKFLYLLTYCGHARQALADETMSYVINGGWRLDWAGEYQLDDVNVLYDRSNDSVEEFVSLRQTPVDLNVLVSTPLYTRL